MWGCGVWGVLWVVWGVSRNIRCWIPLVAQVRDLVIFVLGGVEPYTSVTPPQRNTTQTWDLAILSDTKVFGNPTVKTASPEGR